ncbi:hypothetical protein QTP70_028066 [Hemibagrus guttatus]|uniref:ribonuclease H n=1 Tax=Hemibagrus guttatus TaxID=175788 RepID=A0AAE0UJ78_9TELE|nr:hypothetical protein QTP70_028066 [Hemibagrus guttatus]
MNEENEREKRVEGVNSVEQKVDKIRKDEVRKALKRMKSGKAVGPDDIPVEVWKCLGEAAVEFLASLFNRVLESERMPEEWRRSVLVPIFKNKGDVQSCSNYRGIKLMSHTMKLWERVVEARLRKVVEIGEQQYGFMPRKSTIDAIFALRILMEKYRDGQRELHCVFVDLEKAYDRVPREELWYCMRKSGAAEKYVRVVQDMYERSRTVVRCAVGQTEEFKVEVGLHQGSALSPFLFAIVMDQLSEEVRQESPWTMMFADDIVICSESREQVKENLERWRFALERRGMKVSRSKTEYMCVNEREGSGTVRLQGEAVKKVQEFKYLVQSNGECGKEVKKRVQAGWNGWRKVSGVLCERKISGRIKGKVYRTVVRAAMLYGLETVSLRKRQESELEVAELKMLRFSLGVTRLDRIRNEYIRGTAHVGRLGDKVREARLRWFGHVQRRESEYIGRRMLDMELPGRRQRGRPKRRYMDGINEDMKLVGASVEDAEDRDRWREMIRWKDVQQVRVIKDRDGRVLTSEESVQRRWKEYFEELMNEENEKEKRVEGVNSVEQKVDKIRKDEVRKALKRMKSGKAVGPDDIPVEVWKCLGEAAVEFLTSLFNRVLESERMPEEWRRSVLVPIFKNKGDVQSCSNYRGIKLMSHTMKLWERVVEARLRKVVEICEQQYGFMPRKSTTDAIFALRILMEKYRDGQRELHCVFVDLEKAYDRVPREELWYCMRKSGVAEKYVRVVQDMYERSRTVVRCAVGQTEEFNVEVGLHQGSALSPFLFAIVMDQLSEEVRQESPWTMMFADDIVICSESREQVEESLERWRFALERRGMKISRSKTEYMCVNEREGSGTVRLQGEEVKKVQDFKYLGSTVQSNGECGKEVKKRVQAGWNGWRKVSGVLCDRKISGRIKGKVYRTVVRAAMLYGLETVSLRKRQESELEVAELKMLRFSLGVTRLDRIRNEYIRGTAHVGRLGDKVREDRLRWFGHVQRRESEYIGRRMLDMELPGRRQRGRPKRRYMDGINEDMKLVGASVEDAEDRDRWREMIRFVKNYGTTNNCELLRTCDRYFRRLLHCIKNVSLSRRVVHSSYIQELLTDIVAVLVVVGALVVEDVFVVELFVDVLGVEVFVVELFVDVLGVEVFVVELFVDVLGVEVFVVELFVDVLGMEVFVVELFVDVLGVEVFGFVVELLVTVGMG